MDEVIATRYRLIREVGRGGMGAVWLAQDTLLKREVALKRVGVMPGAAGADIDRVRREARLSAQLSHAHIVSAFDLVHDGDDHWLVMEYLDCKNLSTIIREHTQLTPDETAHLIGQAARGLAEAHESGIVHRDVKPSNMLVTTDGQVKLSDFGIAHTGDDPTLTRTGLLTGSPGYLAPEVASGQRATLASDIWSLGASIYHALTGNAPYDASENLIGTIYRIVHEEPPRTERADWLEPVLRATMHKEPGERWNASQVAEFLQSKPGSLPDFSAPAAPPTATTTTPVAEPEPTTTIPAVAATQPARAGADRPLLAVLVVAVLAVGGWLAFANGDDSQDRAARATGNSAPPDTSSPASTPAADDMDAFVRDYLDDVTADPQTAWDSLTPAFQAESGGYDSYQGFWKTVENAELNDITSSPDSLSVTYNVTYTMRNGDTSTDDVSLGLEFSDGEYRIASEGGEQ